MNKIYCNDGCQKEFTVNQVIGKTKTLIGNIEKNYFECPHCKQEYVTHYMDDKMKQLQIQIHALRKKEPLKISQKNRLNKLIRRMQFMENQLRLKVEGK